MIIGDQLFKRGVGLAVGARTDERAEPPRGVAGPRAAPHLNRPDVLNALSAELVERLSEALTRAARDDDARVVIIRGAGRVLCRLRPEGGGGARPGRAPWTWPRQRELQHDVDRMLELFDHPKPVIAEVHGYCLAGGCDLMMMCDLAVASDDAMFGERRDPLRLRRGDHGHAVAHRGPKGQGAPVHRRGPHPCRGRPPPRPGQQGPGTSSRRRRCGWLGPSPSSTQWPSRSRSGPSTGPGARNWKRSAPTWTSTP